MHVGDSGLAAVPQHFHDLELQVSQPMNPGLAHADRDNY